MVFLRVTKYCSNFFALSTEAELLIAFSHLFTVLVECSYFNFRAVVKRALFYEDEFLGPDELSLGTGCVANNVRPDELEFNYPVSFCGITAQVRAASTAPSAICKVLGGVALCLLSAASRCQSPGGRQVREEPCHHFIHSPEVYYVEDTKYEGETPRPISEEAHSLLA